MARSLAGGGRGVITARTTSEAAAEEEERADYTGEEIWRSSMFEEKASGERESAALGTTSYGRSNFHPPSLGCMFAYQKLHIVMKI